MINQRTFIEALKMVSLASGKKDVRYYLNGVLFELRPASLTMVATDGHQIAAATIAGQFGDVFADVIITNDDVKALQALFKPHATGPEGFTVEAVTGGMRFTDYTGRALDCLAVDANFPNWRRVEPKGDPSRELGRFGIVGEQVAKAATAIGKLDKSSPGAVVVEVFGTVAHGGVKLSPLKISSTLPGLEAAWLYATFAKL